MPSAYDRFTSDALMINILTASEMLETPKIVVRTLSDSSEAT